MLQKVPEGAEGFPAGPPPSPGPSTDTAHVNLQILGTERRFPVEVLLGPRRLPELLSAAREFTRQATAAALERSAAQGRTVSCGPGCGACCRQLVAISTVEARALAELVEAMPAERRRGIRERFASALRRLEQAGLLDPQAPPGDRALVAAASLRRAMLEEVSRRYFELRVPCPFLEDESCGIHEHRPLVCREYHVVSPAERCARLYQEPVEKVEPPLHMGEVMAALAARIAGTKGRTLPLVLALEWNDRHGAELEATHDGLAMFQAMLKLIEEGPAPAG